MSLVDHLVVQAVEWPPVTGRYDEERSYSLDAHGRPVVMGETRRITEISGERDEPSWPAPEPERSEPESEPPPDTVRTFVEREVDDVGDLAWRAYVTRTETTVRREQPDYDGC